MTLDHEEAIELRENGWVCLHAHSDYHYLNKKAYSLQVWFHPETGVASAQREGEWYHEHTKRVLREQQEMLRILIPTVSEAIQAAREALEQMRLAFITIMESMIEVTN